MSLGWKSLLPLGVANFLIAGLWVLMTSLYRPAIGWLSWAAAAVVILALYFSIVSASQKGMKNLEKRTIHLLDNDDPYIEPPKEDLARTA